jgi:hypothetical protein
MLYLKETQFLLPPQLMRAENPAAPSPAGRIANARFSEATVKSRRRNCLGNARLPRNARACEEANVMVGSMAGF